jgi:two-component system, OmpR family, phosphate regulon sensor histidine kinase PhoR
MNRKTLQRLVILAIVALSGLMTVQIVWFKHAYDLERQQFDEKAHSALRFTARALANAPVHNTPSVKQVSNNTFRVQINSCLQSDSLSNLLQGSLAAYGTDDAYEVAVSDCSFETVLLGYDAKSAKAGQIDTSKINMQSNECYFLNVTFKDKPKELMQEMWFWLFASGCCFLAFAFFGYSLYVLFKEKRLAEMKKDFINNMTHELKTPIANIAVASELLKNPNLNLPPEKVQNYATIIQKENDRLKGQVERVLTLAFLEENKIDLNKKVVDVNQFLEEIKEAFALRIAQRNGMIAFENKALKPFVAIDDFHLSNVIYSLLDNADKYSPNPPNIILTTNNTHRGLAISIKDHGIGIEKSVHKLIFDKFYRVTSGDVHDVKGFGLGLSYAKMIVEAHGGKLEVISELGNGSEFILYLS